ncbi:DNA-3-methyladenine glycosylase [Planococcus sp. CP5-4]|uniref:DNA-3-methyladenine glycosylase family protein n=1 Tax=unclassified Planococcus (in: firmicutes) TaxID=2662419 RepID=UPI001C24A0DF|nr:MULTISPECIES: DNA-3-methyladenine glycosylase [unclassified Planococcus (in: firmicutes)]MBU9674036.1 DNA-3-methyladenine glycosylase [Planococcus sp. CP5-4_YE]MBV0909907.1 DNA-3-methyladenine glycosylase [Planococcus sp. CP5-4_UN]MBW6064787.1 DNA-3-methyladenine glycosylase [Planococcus sp. CP5-4]
MDSETKTQGLEIPTPKEFNFTECLAILGRSDQELLHTISGERITKLLNAEGELVLFELSYSGSALHIEFLHRSPSEQGKQAVMWYVMDWFDLETDLQPFYAMAASDPVLREVVEQHAGLRIMGMPDLFEAFAWAITGQQINLTFAYTLKRRLIENFGSSTKVGEVEYWTFPSAGTIASLEVGQLRELQFSGRKAEYIIGIARELANGHLVKEELVSKTEQQVEKQLVAIRGVGPWSAHYVMMKCLRFNSAFPISDVGLHNALKEQLGMGRKPTIAEIEGFAKNWTGWQAYATFYLWRVLL